MNEFRRLIGPLEHRVRLMAGRAVITGVDDGPMAQELQIEQLHDERHDGVEHFQGYGFTSRPLSGAEVVTVSIGGLRSHQIAVGVVDRRHRPTGLEPGEAALYDDQGQHVKLKRDGIDVRTSKAATIAAEGPVAIEGESVAVSGPVAMDGSCAIEGPVEMAGPLTAEGPVAFGEPLPPESGGTGVESMAALRLALGVPAEGEAQPASDTLDGLDGLGPEPGLVEQTSENVFAIRPIGAANDNDVLTRADGDGRYSPIVHAHALADVTGLIAALAAKAPLASPALTGTPTAPTAADATSNTQLATTAFVHSLITNLINASPATLDTLKELADAIGDDPNFATTVATSIATKLAKASNLSDLTNAATARGNLGVAIGSDVEAHDPTLTAFAGVAWAAGVQVPVLTAADTFALKTVGSAAGNILDKAAGDGLYQPLDTDLSTIAGLTATTDNFIVSVASAWASRTPAQVRTTLSISNVDNTSDANKPVSTAQQAALDLKAPLASPALTGTPTAPTAADATSNTQLATTAFVHSLITNLINASPATLDTLKELADAIGDDPNFATTVATSIATKLAKASNLSDLTNAATARGNLGVAIGSDVEAHDPTLTAFAGVAWAAGVQVPVLTAADTFALKTVGSAAGNILDKAAGDGLYQPLDTDLSTIAGLTATTDNFIVSVASAWASRTPAQVRTTLSLGTMALETAANYALLAGAAFTGDSSVAGTVGVSATQLTIKAGDGGYGAGIAFSSRLFGGGALTSMVEMTADGADSWTSTTSTQDAYFTLRVRTDGTLTDRLRVDNGGLYLKNHSTTASAANAFVDSSTGQVLRSTSSEIYKRNMTPISADEARAILDRLRPLRYQSNVAACPSDDPGAWFYGLSAEKVAAEADPSLVHWGYPEAAFDRRYKRRPVLRKGAEKAPQAVMYERICVLQEAVRQADAQRLDALELRLAALEEHSHPPIDLEPAIRDILRELRGRP